MKCPHSDIRFCPLYHAAHTGTGGSCDDGKLDSGECAVSRGLNYGQALKKLEIDQFELVAECEYNQRWHERNEQRKRNMQSAGLH